MIIYTPKIIENIQNYLIFNLYIKLINHYLNSDLYYANLCLTGFSVSHSRQYVSIKFKGFKGGIEKIIERVILEFNNLKVSEKDFNFIKSNFKNYLENCKYEEPFLIVDDYFDEKVYNINYTIDELLKELSNIEMENITIPKKWLFNDCYLKTLIYGNINQQDVYDLIKYFDVFNTKYINIKNSIYKLMPLNPGDEQLYLKKSSNPEDNNNVISLFFEFKKTIRHQTKDWDTLYLTLAILDLHIGKKFFADLRSKQQTGYVVRGNLKKFMDIEGILIGYNFLIQSSSYDPIILKNKIKKFVLEMYDELKNITDDEFKSYKKNIKYELQSKFQTPNEEYNFFLSEIVFGYNDFNINQILLKSLLKVNKNMMLETYYRYFIDKNTRKIRTIAYYANKKN